MISDFVRTLPLPDWASTTEPAQELRVAGNRRLLSDPGIGVCGARDASERGLEIASEIGRLCAEFQVSLIAGDARGVDDVAQTSALQAGGNVIAVLAEGLAHWRPRRSYRGFLDEDLSTLCVVSQFEDHHRWQPYRAMARNGTVIALSRVVFVIDARDDGGTFAAGKETLRRKRPLLVLGDDLEGLTSGSRELVRCGGEFVPVDALTHMISSVASGELIAAGQQGRLLP